jgi:hypothetical protein
LNTLRCARQQRKRFIRKGEVLLHSFQPAQPVFGIPVRAKNGACFGNRCFPLGFLLIGQMCWRNWNIIPFPILHTWPDLDENLHLIATTQEERALCLKLGSNQGKLPCFCFSGESHFMVIVCLIVCE